MSVCECIDYLKFFYILVIFIFLQHYNLIPQGNSIEIFIVTLSPVHFKVISCYLFSLHNCKFDIYIYLYFNIPIL